MIITKRWSNIKCDNCGAILSDELWIDPEDIGTLKDIAKESEWTNHHGKHYCPYCYSYDSKGRLVINKERTKV